MKFSFCMLCMCVCCILVSSRITQSGSWKMNLSFLRWLCHAYLLHYIILVLAHICSYTLDHTEPELKEPMEQAQAKDPANLTLDQGKPWCIPLIFLGFSFNHYLYDLLECALSYRNYVGTIVALWLSFRTILDYPF
jgi:hypothetical protein